MRISYPTYYMKLTPQLKLGIATDKTPRDERFCPSCDVIYGRCNTATSISPAQVRRGEPSSNSSFVICNCRTTEVRLVPKVKNQNNRKQPHLRFWARDISARRKYLRRFPLNVRAVSAKIKLPCKKNIWSTQSHFENR